MPCLVFFSEMNWFRIHPQDTGLPAFSFLRRSRISIAYSLPQMHFTIHFVLPWESFSSLFPRTFRQLYSCPVQSIAGLGIYPPHCC